MADGGLRGDLLGAVLAGGRSQRYGAPKALVEVGGRALILRAVDALRDLNLTVVVLGDPDILGEVAGAGKFPVHPDYRAGHGPLGGLETALRLARDRGLAGVLLLACDMPLVTGDLLRTLLGEFDGRGPLVPASPGPLGLEPLCACYPTGALQAVERQLDGGGGAFVDVLPGTGARVIPLEKLARVVDLSTCFLNVNTREDRALAETLLGGPDT